MQSNYIPFSESQVLTLIDLFIQEVYSDSINEEQFKARLIELIPSFKVIFDSRLWYNQTIMSLMKIIPLVHNMLGNQSYDNIAFLSEELVSYLRDQLFVYKWLAIRQWRAFQKQEQDNQKRLSHYIGQLTNHYAKLLFVRIDLHYLKEAQAEYGIVEFNHHMATMRNRLANQDGCFQDLHGYAWALEQGLQRGYHCHLLLIYDGHKHQNDYGLALLAGEVWREITNSKGTFFTSNEPAYKQKFECRDELGIGMIHRSNERQVANAIKSAVYLVNPEKEEQQLRAKLPYMRSFGTGEFNVPWRRRIQLI